MSDNQTIEGDASSSTQAPSGQADKQSELELKARDMGWRGLDEFEGDPSDFIDAGEFVRRKPLFDKIEANGKQLKSVTKSLEYLKEHYQKVKETEYNRALASLQEQITEAKREGNRDLASDIKEEHQRVEGERDEFLAEVEAIKVEPTVAPEFEAWVGRNSWYSNSESMRAFADVVGVRLHKQGIAKDQVLVQVEKAVKKEFPEKFRNPNRDSAPAVEGSTPRQPKKDNPLDTSFMSEQDIRVMNQLVRDKVMTKEKYIADIKLAYGVK
jgi:hypothetical protein